ncbi:hypothetical protein [Nonomuraea sp. SYSU D8015]|uniref:hypothetical protein n=1 Tax=Nonomuraea sp. SYSU D8015 TaxID=2593644 RepID=UPI001660E771|nr:hypothetical protein [Nonomuraea sp. SYSU D8015]
MVWIGYPLHGPADGAPAGGRDDRLGFLVGDVRSAILPSLERPLTMGALARRQVRAFSGPNAVTYHCDRLESAELITRHRDGWQIYVRRTKRGSALMSLFTW